MYSKIIPIFTPEWWVSFLVFLLVLVGGLLFPYLCSERVRKKGALLLSFFLVWNTLFLQFYLHYREYWDVRSSLPLQYCNLMTLVGALALMTRWRWAFEVAIFLGLIEPFQAIIAPGFAYSGSSYLIFDYYFSHFGAIYASLFLLMHAHMTPREGAWWRVSTLFLFAGFVVMALNKLLGANYMFLLERPDIEHPLNFGQWPYYLIVWAFEVLAIACAIHLIVKRRGWKGSL